MAAVVSADAKSHSSPSTQHVYGDGAPPTGDNLCGADGDQLSALPPVQVRFRLLSFFGGGGGNR